MRVIHVLRKSLSEGTVAANVVKHGVGGLNIDGSRVQVQAWDQKSEGGRNTGHKDQRGRQLAFALSAGNPDDGKGRWPANVILQHLDGCRCDGIKKVKAGSNNKGTPDGGASTGECYGDYGTRSLVHHADEDGKESVANWICAEGCPVAALDEQTLSNGMHGAGAARRKTVQGSVESTTYNMGGEREVFYYGDKGGASRFFKQVGGQTE